MSRPKKNQEVELQIEKFADRGKSLGRLDGYVVMVNGAVPGDRVRVRIGRRKKKYADGWLQEVLEPSPLRTDPRCSYFGSCGGCKWQHVQYEAQLEAKQQSVKEALARVGGFADVEVPPTLGADPIYYYRNKMEFSFSAARWLTPAEIASGAEYDTSFALGLHAPGNFSKVIDLDACYLQSELSASIVNAVRDLAKEEEWKPWDIRAHEGYLRHLVIRQAGQTDHLMVNLVTNGYDEARIERITRLFQESFPAITTLVNTIHTGKGQTAIGEEIVVVYGPGVIYDRIGPFTFEIAPDAFFQTNTRQAEQLYNVALDFAGLTGEEHVYDLYCGAGTISLFLAQHARHVVGLELVPSAVSNAIANAAANKVTNCSFVAGDMLKLLTPELVRSVGRPDVLVTDPPRAGMHPKVVAQLAELKPGRLVYVSCNPQTQARDLGLLAEHYTIERVQPVDLFPHTHHIENVVLLKLK